MVFFWLILGAFLLSLYCYKTDRIRGFTHYAPNLLTSLGILGTFIGIVIGLMHFDPADIDNSITLLLSGLQTAFMTSLFGMASAIAFKVVTTSVGFMQPNAVTSISPQEVGPEDIHAILQAQTEILAKLRHAIAGDEDGSLVSQLKLLRLDNHDLGNKLDSIDKSNQKQLGILVELLRESERQTERFEQFSVDIEHKLDGLPESFSKSPSVTLHKEPA
ncbi:hypothetical protein L861_19560 [Litchfieldella anticariensis FP35 = DSM 16096]|uniref:MotA/TolQ/ExbB proton channel domain-containing protein n=1 Tax=Litchfieldella anticariensis (strain DSM 16096 / CECT 5854 / CIP 108499 / LMG 22089 / FP35) TaxID=1121939 RepID=S2KIQ4_LITA3|nr:hypothetical protein [Halomonas anticariensis]EPC01850.1 hypothetical protein L861_19560 [Halomonas anticariensis FP35 = DSM 16096]